MLKPSLAAVIAIAGLALTGISQETAPKVEPQQNNAEIEQMFKADQADRSSNNISIEDWHLISERDEKRRTRAMELIQGGDLKSGRDFYCAAMIFQHADEPDGYKLAHELAVTAISLGSKDAKWLAAASWDRFLLSIEHKQRYGTQFWIQDKKASLRPVDEKITDTMRTLMNCPTLEQAKKRAAEMQKQIDGSGQ